MKRLAIFLALILLPRIFYAQIVENKYREFFKEAYAQNPGIPEGILEAVAYTNTRFAHIDETFAESSTGMPKAWGVMGLIEDGKNYFNENLKFVAEISGYSADKIKHDPRINILAYAKAFDVLAKTYNIKSSNPADYFPVFQRLTEIPLQLKLRGNDFAFNSFLYSVFTFLNNKDFAKAYGFEAYNIDLEQVFGEDLKILSAPKVFLGDSIYNSDGETFKGTLDPCPDYNVDSCQWVPADPSNYSSRNGTAISAIVIHTIQGSYSGCISWFQNPDANASAHYVLRSSDGQITQMVREADKAWHVRDENPYTVGYEHEGYIEQQGWYTDAMYRASAGITRHVCAAYGINPHRMFYRDTLDDGTVLDSGVHPLAGDSYCTKIAGHQHYPNNTHTDPGPNWNWNYYYRLVNDGNGDVYIFTDTSGTFYDSGGPDGNYSDDERKIYIIKPSNGDRILLTFNSFDLEANYDFLYIYDGEGVFNPLIGRWNTQSPGTVVSSGNALTIEFRSDCATTAQGWSASWNTIPFDTIPPTTEITTDGGDWKTDDFTAFFNDQDNDGIQKAYYQVIEFDGQQWTANTDNGFFADNFMLDNINTDIWTVQTGTWSIQDGNLAQTDESLSNTNIYAPLNQTLSNRYLYDFWAKAGGSGTNRRFGFHFFADNGAAENRGNSYFVWFRIDDQALQFYKVVNDTFHLVRQVDNIVTIPDQWYHYTVIYDRTTGETWVYRDYQLLEKYTFDPLDANTGQYISFRTGNATMQVSQIKVYRSRYPQVTVTVGSENTNDIRFCNPSPDQIAAKVKSIVQDNSDYLSEIAYYDLNVDFTPPADFTVNDGQGSDIDVLNSLSEYYGNWTASSDPNSGIAKYLFSLGTQPGSDDVVSWTDNGLNTSCHITNLNLQPNVTYYLNVKAVNNAGLETIVSSDGAAYYSSLSVDFSVENTNVCTYQQVRFTNNSQNATGFLWTFEGGTPSQSTDENPTVTYYQSGSYDVTLKAWNDSDTITLTKNDFITVANRPIPGFTAEQTELELPNAQAVFVNTSQYADSYLWDFGDGNLSTAENPTHYYGEAGTYTVSLTAQNNECPDSTLVKENFITVMETSQATSETQYEIYPVPVSNYLIIKSKAEITKVEVLSTDGRTIISLTPQTRTNTISVDLQSLKQGAYLIKIYDRNDIFNRKIIKK